MDPRAGASTRPAARHGPRSAAPSPPPAVEAAPPAGTPDRVREGCAARSRADPAGEASLCCAPGGGSVELERSLPARPRRGGEARRREQEQGGEAAAAGEAATCLALLETMIFAWATQ